ncbi:MAG: 23S rRNA (guanosine(2251)-2'-O)-methyltransferase RlmB [Sphingomonadaceae bacterium]
MVRGSGPESDRRKGKAQSTEGGERRPTGGAKGKNRASHRGRTLERDSGPDTRADRGRARGPAPAKEGGRRPESRAVERPVVRMAPEQEILYGRNAVMEALRAGKRVRRLLVSGEATREEPVREAIRLATAAGVVTEEVRREQLDAVAPEHQGMAAVVAPFEYVGWGDLLERLSVSDHPPVVLLLDTLQDPQNLGSLLRTSEAVGVDAVVLPKRRSVHVTPAVVRSSAGAVEHMAVARVPNLVRAAEELKGIGIWVAGIDMAGDRLHWKLDMTGPTALVLGGEDRGIGQLMKESCDFLIRLPMKGHVSSLNAAVAGSVVLYEMLRQRGG